MSQGGGEIQRFTLKERLVHWAVGISFVYVMLTGLALFSPHLYWLAAVLGGGVTIRRWHPIIGVILFIATAWMYRLWRGDMKIDAEDKEWLRQIGKYIRNQEEGLPEAGRFNAGQKQLFWLQVISITLLLLSGIPLWFPHTFPHWLRLVSVFVHEIAALAAIGGLIVHIYMGTAVVRGSLRAIINGTVSHAWAKAHHPRWYRAMTSRQ